MFIVEVKKMQLTGVSVESHSIHGTLGTTESNLKTKNIKWCRHSLIFIEICIIIDIIIIVDISFLDAIKMNL